MVFNSNFLKREVWNVLCWLSIHQTHRTVDKTVQSITLFGTPDIFYNFTSNDHHKCCCKAAINQTFQWAKLYVLIPNLRKPGRPQMWFDPTITIISSRKRCLTAGLQAFVGTTQSHQLREGNTIVHTKHTARCEMLYYQFLVRLSTCRTVARKSSIGKAWHWTIDKKNSTDVKAFHVLFWGAWHFVWVC